MVWCYRGIRMMTSDHSSQLKYGTTPGRSPQSASPNLGLASRQQVSRFKPNVLHGRQYTNRRHQSLKPTNCSGAGSSNSTRFFSPMVGQLRAHSLHPDYLPHSIPTPIPHSTSPTPPPINRGGAQGDSAQGLHTAGRPDLTTWF